MAGRSARPSRPSRIWVRVTPVTAMARTRAKAASSESASTAVDEGEPPGDGLDLGSVRRIGGGGARRGVLAQDPPLAVEERGARARRSEVAGEDDAVVQARPPQS